ncbi:hypothetical protein Y032_0018g3686 [Ancylostoma ceylanicum]|uniref:Uncharacterized protein n=1 Tax=Ancylostoma ceylanicum TaxID=53326 RepID=A0A016V5T4_9BILA|nr:hypothetical protein Y032_0018g3686 [Ancylostoma ceylanicum]
MEPLHEYENVEDYPRKRIKAAEEGSPGAGCIIVITQGKRVDSQRVYPLSTGASIRLPWVTSMMYLGPDCRSLP